MCSTVQMMYFIVLVYFTEMSCYIYRQQYQVIADFSMWTRDWHPVGTSQTTSVCVALALQWKQRLLNESHDEILYNTGDFLTWRGNTEGIQKSSLLSLSPNMHTYVSPFTQAQLSINTLVHIKHEKKTFKIPGCITSSLQ